MITLRPGAQPLLSALQRRLARAEPTLTRLSGGRGSGRSTVLQHLASSAGVPLVAIDAIPPGASPAAAMIGALIRHLQPPGERASPDDPAAARLRLLARAAYDAEHHDRTEPSPLPPIDALASALREHLKAPCALLLDGADALSPPEQQRVLRAIASLRAMNLPLHIVIAIEPGAAEVCHALPFALQLPPVSADDLDNLIASLIRHRSEGLTATQASSLPAAFASLPACTPRQVVSATQAYLHVIQSEDPGPSDPHLDEDLAAWLAAVHRWPVLRAAFRARDVVWWRDLRLVLDQAIARRLDALLDALLAEPGIVPFLMTRLPSPKGAGATQLAATLQRWHAAEARASRWGA